MCVWQYSQYIPWHMYIICHIYEHDGIWHETSTIISPTNTQQFKQCKQQTNAISVHAYAHDFMHAQSTPIYHGYIYIEVMNTLPLTQFTPWGKTLRPSSPLWQYFQNCQWQVMHRKCSQLCHCSHTKRQRRLMRIIYTHDSICSRHSDKQVAAERGQHREDRAVSFSFLNLHHLDHY